MLSNIAYINITFYPILYLNQLISKFHSKINQSIWWNLDELIIDFYWLVFKKNLLGVFRAWQFLSIASNYLLMFKPLVTSMACTMLSRVSSWKSRWNRKIKEPWNTLNLIETYNLNA